MLINFFIIIWSFLALVGGDIANPYEIKVMIK